MKEIKPDVDRQTSDKDFLPVYVDAQQGHMTCVCGYELVKSDANFWRCTGGSHTYNLQEGDVIQDKFGNILVRPQNQGEDNANGK